MQLPLARRSGSTLQALHPFCVCLVPVAVRLPVYAPLQLLRQDAVCVKRTPLHFVLAVGLQVPQLLVPFFVPEWVSLLGVPTGLPHFVQAMVLTVIWPLHRDDGWPFDQEVVHLGLSVHGGGGGVGTCRHLQFGLVPPTSS